MKIQVTFATIVYYKNKCCYLLDSVAKRLLHHDSIVTSNK